MVCSLTPWYTYPLIPPDPPAHLIQVHLTFLMLIQNLSVRYAIKHLTLDNDGSHPPPASQIDLPPGLELKARGRARHVIVVEGQAAPTVIERAAL